MENNTLARQIAGDLLKIRAVFFRPEEPFTWASGIKSPIYCDNRLTLTAPAVRTHVEEVFFGGVRVFVSMVIIAMILNVGVYHLFGAVGIDETFNMFYISPYFDCTLPLLSIVWDMVPYGVFVCIYFFGFILCALIVFGLMKAMTCRMKSYKPERILISQALEKTTV